MEQGGKKTGDGKTASAPSYLTLQAAFFTFACFGMRTLASLDSSPASPHPPSRHRGCNCKSNWVRDPDKLCSLTWDPTAIKDGSPRTRGEGGDIPDLPEIRPSSTGHYSSLSFFSLIYMSRSRGSRLLQDYATSSPFLWLEAFP